MPKYDAVVIGAGLGGLTAACRLAASGKRTLLIEKHNLPGGVASSFRRGRFEFDTALHELCEWGDEKNSGACRDVFYGDFGLDIGWKKIPDCFRVITTGSDGVTQIDATLPSGRERFISKMEELVPGCRKSVVAFFQLATEIYNATQYTAQGNADSKVLMEKYPNFLRVGSYTVNKVLDAIKMPQAARDILCTYWGYLGVDCDRLPFIEYATMVLLYVTMGAYIPEKTSNQITTGLVERFREMGGEVWLNCEAKKICFDDDAVCGVATTGGYVETKHVICNANPGFVYANMLPKERVPERLVKLTNQRKYSARMFVVFLGLDKSAEELGIKDYCYFLPETADTVKEYNSRKTIETNNNCTAVCYNVVNPSASPEGTSILTLTTFFTDDCWSKVDPERYNEIKTEYAEDLIDIFEENTKISLRPYIEEYVVATPLTYARYASVPQGAAYGYELTEWDSVSARMQSVEADNPIKGLKFCGAHSVRGDGYDSVAYSGDLMAKLTLAEMNGEG